MAPPWDEVFAIAGVLKNDSWLLIGGLMTQAHAHLAGIESRATTDIDLLIDVMTSNANVNSVIDGLKSIGYSPQQPGLRGSAFHRMIKETLVVDVLVAEHLPSRKKLAAKVNRWPIMEAPSGAQALERKKTIILRYKDIERRILIPDALGALVLKAAAFATDNRGKNRHLTDVALLASLIIDHATEIERLQGSDKKRLRSVAAALADTNHFAWLGLPEIQRIKGQDTLRILSA